MKTLSCRSFLLLSVSLSVLVFPAMAEEAGGMPQTADQIRGLATKVMKDLLPKDKGNESFMAALTSAYENNPTLLAARAETRAVFERLPQAESGWRPTISASGEITGTSGSTDPDLGTDESYLTRGAALSLEQPLYRGGRTVAETEAARNVIRAQLAALDLTEQTILLQAATAYLDVLRDEALLKLASNNQSVIRQQYDGTKKRFEVGELTRTDVSQAEARQARADSGVITARANVRSSRAEFERLVGYPPGDLGYPLMDIDMPGTLDEALAYAENWNPSVRSARHAHRAAEKDVDSQAGSLLPTVSLNGDMSKSYDPSGSLDSSEAAALGVVASIPLYEAGYTRSRVRESKKVSQQKYAEIFEAQRLTREQVTSTWEALQAARAEVTSRLAQVEASEVARFGVRQEADLGSRTTLDVLDAEQELLDAQVALVSASRNEVVALYSLAAALGVLNPKTLGFADKVPDYNREIERVRGDLFGTNVDSPGPVQ